jgi:hypothetical protein
VSIGIGEARELDLREAFEHGDAGLADHVHRLPLLERLGERRLGALDSVGMPTYTIKSRMNRTSARCSKPCSTGTVGTPHPADSSL